LVLSVRWTRVAIIVFNISWGHSIVLVLMKYEKAKNAPCSSRSHIPRRAMRRAAKLRGTDMLDRSGSSSLIRTGSAGGSGLVAGPGSRISREHAGPAAGRKCSMTEICTT
jgi:hypothetical protein